MQSNKMKSNNDALLATKYDMVWVVKHCQFAWENALIIQGSSYLAAFFPLEKKINAENLKMR